jgi:hypothetical protein
MSEHTPSPVTLDFVAQQQARILNEFATFRDDLRVMMAIIQRLDGTVGGLVNEVRASHSRHDRLVRRVETLEGNQS